MEPLERQLDRWPVDYAAVSVLGRGGELTVSGDTSRVLRVASISKLLAAMATLVAVEEETVGLDEPAGPPGSTVRHLLAHTSGLLFDEHRVITEPGRRRIYSNAGIEQLAEHVSDRAGISFEEYQRLGVLEPLNMSSTGLRGSPARDVYSNVADLSRFALELLDPTLVSAGLFAHAVEVHFPGTRGVVPGLGSFDPNPWGLGFEIRGEKDPHWTGRNNSARTFGHFGGTGTFLWVDPRDQLAVVGLTDRPFGAWSLEYWPAFSDSVLEAFGSPSTRAG